MPKNIGHHPPQEAPVRLRGRSDQRVAGGFIDEPVEADIGGDQRADVLRPDGRAALRHDLSPARGNRRVAGLRRAAGRERVQHRADRIAVPHGRKVQRRHIKPACAPLLHEAVRFQHGHRLLHGLAADTELRRQLLLNQMHSGREGAVANLVEDRL